MHTRVKSEVISLAQAAPAAEVCGFLIDHGGLKTFPCSNASPEPAESFEIDPQDHIRALRAGRIMGVYHSHPDDSSFSPADLTYAEEAAYPLFLYSVASDTWREYLPPTYSPALIGRSWVLGLWDCFGIVRDYYRQHFDYYISDYDRDESYDHEERDLIMRNFEQEGFQQISVADACVYDLLVFKTNKALPQHFGILTSPQHMLHHVQNGLSGEEVISGRWLERAICAFRLKRKPDLV
jgi:proteasome lid subunit RPN8/RPN11